MTLSCARYEDRGRRAHGPVCEIGFQYSLEELVQVAGCAAAKVIDDD